MSKKHTHNVPEPSFSQLDLLSMDYTPAGEVRHTLKRLDGSQELVGIENLMAVLSRFSIDASGNRFGAYFVLPEDFWRSCRKELLEKHGRIGSRLPRDKYGGYMGVFPYCTIYSGGTDLVLVRTDHNGLCWSFIVTDHHELMRKPDIRLLV